MLRPAPAAGPRTGGDSAPRTRTGPPVAIWKTVSSGCPSHRSVPSVNRRSGSWSGDASGGGGGGAGQGTRHPPPPPRPGGGEGGGGAAGGGHAPAPTPE